jgi:hypothetical protein
MMHWDYRVFLEDDGYIIRTVYYDDKGEITACSEKSVEPFGESLEDLQEEVDLLQEALRKKVLRASDIPPQTARPKVKRGKSLQAVREQFGLRSQSKQEDSLATHD